MAREFSKGFYKSKAWQDTRKYIFDKYNGICQKCGEPGEEVHHIIFLRPSNIDDPDIALGEDNLILLCKNCHSLEHQKTNPGFKKRRPLRITADGLYFDENGELLEVKVRIVYGAPASGKTTYVKQNMAKGDLVVDLDYIKQAISFCDRDDVEEGLVDVAIEIRKLLYNLIENRKVACKNVWVIAGLPRRQEREELASRLRGELVFIESTVHECLERVDRDHSRTDKLEQRRIIDSWFANYER